MISDILTPAAQTSYKSVAGIISVAKASAEAHAKATHERFNIFSTLLKETDEVRLHTRFIHCLLDPNGTHDCGSLFLDLFFQTLTSEGVLDKKGNALLNESDQKPVNFEHLSQGRQWTVHKEASRSPHGQIDLLLESSGFFGIAIENKIHAREQEDQLSGYGDYLRSRYEENSFHLIYLTLDGKQGTTAGDHSYLRISYKRHILHWLDACLRETYSIIPINQTLIQYRAVVRRLTHQTLENKFMKPVHDFIRGNPEILRHSNLITQAVDQVRSEVLAKFGDGIMKAVMEFVSDAKIDPKHGKFGVGDQRAVWITPAASVLGVLQFNIWIEIAGERLLIGMKVPQGLHSLPPDIQRVLNEMCSFMNNDPDRSESREFDSSNRAWPTGWDKHIYPLNDDLIADWLRMGTESAVAEVSKAVRSHIDLLERAYTAASEQISSAIA